MSGLLGCDLPSLEEFKPFIVLLQSAFRTESLEKKHEPLDLYPVLMFEWDIHRASLRLAGFTSSPSSFNPQCRTQACMFRSEHISTF
jgi:hypothetical protein